MLEPRIQGRSGLLSHDQTPAMPSSSVVEILLELTMSFCYRCWKRFVDPWLRQGKCPKISFTLTEFS
jgi:hypothetical protein